MGTANNIKNVFVIDDNTQFVASMRVFLEKKYGQQISFFPKKSDQYKLAQEMGMLKEEVQEHIINNIKNEIISKCTKSNDIVMIDLNLNYEKSSNDSHFGKELYEKLLAENKDLDIYILSRFSYANNSHTWKVEKHIVKPSDESLTEDLKKEILHTVFNQYELNDISQQVNNEIGNVVSAEDTNNQANESGNTYYYKGYNDGRNNEKEIAKRKKARIANIIGMWLKIIALILLCLAPIDIICYGYASKLNAIIVAERLFIAFLPTLIVFGLYVFYERSIKRYIEGYVDDVDEEKINNTIAIFHLTKKLFIISLISYLFLKLVEIIFVKDAVRRSVTDINSSPKTDSLSADSTIAASIQKTEAIIPIDSLSSAERYIENFKTIYQTENHLFIIYITGGLIILLMIFYIIIDRGHKGNH